MAQTRKDIIINKYLEFKQELKNNNCDCSIFPDLEDVDLVDLLVLFNLNFNSGVDINVKLNELCELNGVNLSTDVKSICKRFINWFLLFQKN